jgi:hypothetical protein
MVNEAGHINHLKVLRFTCFWGVHVTHFDHQWWPFLVSLNASRQNLSNDTGGVIIGDLVYF